MIRQALSIAISLLLSLSVPVCAQPQKRAAAPAGPAVSAALSAPAVAVNAIEQASLSASALSAFTARPAASDAEALARAIAAYPVSLDSAAAGAQAAALYGPRDVSRLKAAATKIGSLSTFAAFRDRQPRLSPAKIGAALEKTRLALEALGHRAEDSLAVSGNPSAPARLARSIPRPSRIKSAIRNATMALALSAGFIHSSPAVSRSGVEQQSQAPVVNARDINDVIARWSPEAHLYVVGDVGLDQGTLQRLAADLDDKHWTVVLVADASGSVYRDADGRTHYNDEAVEYGLQGIFKKGGFSAQTHPQTGESDGAIFTVVIGQRMLLLRTSQAHDLRGLNGEKGFKGNLDRWAVSNMKSGGNIEGAIRDTISNVDRLLNDAIDNDFTSAESDVARAKALNAELDAAASAFAQAHPEAGTAAGLYDATTLAAAVAKGERALAAKDARGASAAVAAALSQGNSALSAMRSFDSAAASAQEDLRSAAASLDELAQASASFRESHEKAAGDLARPDVEGMRQSLRAAAAVAGSRPTEASTQAKAVSGQARVILAALHEHVSGADVIAAAERTLQDLQGRGNSGAAVQDLVTARQALEEARQEHAAGSSAWKSRLDQAKAALDSSERAIASADASAAAKRAALWVLSMLAGLGTLGLGFFLHRRTLGARRKAEELYATWFTGLDKKMDAIIDEIDTKMDVYVGPESGPNARNWSGDTAALAAQVRQDSGYAILLLASAQNVLTQADTLIHPKTLWGRAFNYFWPARFKAALHKLQDEKVAFQPQDGLEAVFGQSKNWRDDLYGDVSAYQPFQKSFNELIAEFNAKAKAAVTALDSIENAAKNHGPVLDAVAASIASVEATKAALEAPGDGLFLVPSIFASALPAAKAALSTARATVKTDPVGGLNGSGAGATRVQADSAALIQAILDKRTQTIPAIVARTGALAAAGIVVAWLEKALQKLSGTAETIASDLVKASVGESVKKLGAGIDALAVDAGRAVATLADLAKGRADAGQLSAKVAAARAEIAKALGLASEATLVEDTLDPSDRLARAAKADADGRSSLGQGALDDAAAAAAAAAERLAQGDAIVDASLASLRGHDATVIARRAETSHVESLVPEHQQVLAEITRQFADSVLSLGAGDPSHPNGNGTLEDNVVEATQGLAQAKAKHGQAVSVFRQGQLLAAAALLDQVKAHQEGALHRLGEIVEKMARLRAAAAANAAAAEALEARAAGYQGDIGRDRRAMKPTLKALAAAKQQVVSARAAVDAVKGDPFKSAQALTLASAALDQVYTQIRNDRDAYAESERSLKSARGQLDAAAAQARAAAGDSVADSPAIRQANADLHSLEASYKRAVAALGVDHNDWNAVDSEADRLTSEAGRVAAALRGEIAAAERATSSISSAAAKVREATNWTGAYGVYITGSPGSGSLNSARASLASGDYEGAIRHAESARHAAAAAISDAESEVSSRRRAEEARQRREEAERQRRADEARRQRQREEESRRSSSSGSSWGSSSSGSGRSSYGGSSSGSGRSGW